MRDKASRAARESALASGWTVEGDPEAVPDPPVEPALQEDSEAAHPTRASDGDAAQLETGEGQTERKSGVSNGALVALGVFGGLYLLYTAGWFMVAQAYSAFNAYTAAGSGSIGGILQQVIFWAAPLAPALWFFMALVLSRGGRTARLSILLAIGAVVLLPLPMLIARGG